MKTLFLLFLRYKAPLAFLKYRDVALLTFFYIEQTIIFLYYCYFRKTLLIFCCLSALTLQELFLLKNYFILFAKRSLLLQKVLLNNKQKILFPAEPKFQMQLYSLGTSIILQFKSYPCQAPLIHSLSSMHQ